MKGKNHFLLVHGVCHGAWCWYKVAAALEASGHQVTVVDLAASGSDTRSIHEVAGFSEYSKPAIDVVESLPEGGRVVLVGHSFGGLTIALVADMFPEKVEAAVFVTACLPTPAAAPDHPIAKLFENSPLDVAIDTQITFNNGIERITFNNGIERPFTSLLFGPESLATLFYQCCPKEDLTIALKNVREGSLFLEDLSKAEPFSEEGFGSIKKFYIVCKADKVHTEEFQHWMINNNLVHKVMEIEGADHMAMLSKPQELCKCLWEIAQKFT